MGIDGAAADQAFQQLARVVQVRNLGDQQKHDYRLTRFAAYLTAMAGDDTKTAVASGHFFVVPRKMQLRVMSGLGQGYPF